MKQEYGACLRNHLQVILSNLHEVIQMVEDGQPCNQIIHQIGVVQQLLREFKSALFLNQVRECISLIQDDPDVNVRIHEITRLQDLYDEKLQAQLILNEVKP